MADMASKPSSSQSTTTATNTLPSATPSSSTTSSKTKKQKKSSNKKKRINPQDQYETERRDKYRTLEKFISKIIRREGKIVKSFECQKVVRKLKALHEEEEEGDDDEKKKNSKKIKNMEEKLALTKSLCLEDVVKVAVRRLGLHGLNPFSEEEDKDKKEGEEDDAKTEKQQQQEKELIEKMLQHKRLSSAIDDLHEKVTEYRRWIMKRETYLKGGDDDVFGEDSMYSSSNKKKKKKKRQREAAAGGGSGETMSGTRNKRVKVGEYGSTSNLFIDSLSGGGGLGDGNEENAYTDNSYVNPYGPGADEYYNEEVVRKKNRPGQRARKAKAMAIQAKKEGRTWDSSINWREKKKQPKEGEKDGKNKNEQTKKKETTASGLKANAKVEAKDIAEMGKSWKEEGHAHPSWAARQSQKAKSGVGIVEFTGKKITF